MTGAGCYRRWPSTMTVVSPLIHIDERVEIMSRFRREPFFVDGELLDIPVYSGNAIRGMLRRAAAVTVCQHVGVRERSLDSDMFYLLFSGGVLRGADYAWRVDEYQRLRNLLPPVGLFGGSFGSRVLHGLVDVDRAVPVCRELASWPGHAGHPAYGDGDVPSVFELLTEVDYTRRDDRAGELAGEKSPVQMRYSFEALVPGTRLIHGLTVRTTDPLLVGCLVDAIARAGENDRLGARGATGHGVFIWEWADTIVAEHAAEHERYLEHLADHADEIRGLLETGQLS